LGTEGLHLPFPLARQGEVRLSVLPFEKWNTLRARSALQKPEARRPPLPHQPSPVRAAPGLSLGPASAPPPQRRCSSPSAEPPVQSLGAGCQRARAGGPWTTLLLFLGFFIGNIGVASSFSAGAASSLPHPLEGCAFLAQGLLYLNRTPPVPCKFAFNIRGSAHLLPK